MRKPQPTLFNFAKKRKSDSEPDSNVQTSIRVIDSQDLSTPLKEDPLHEINLSSEKNLSDSPVFFDVGNFDLKKITEEDKINLATKHIIPNDDFCYPFSTKKYQ